MHLPFPLPPLPLSNAHTMDSLKDAVNAYLAFLKTSYEAEQLTGLLGMRWWPVL